MRQNIFVSCALAPESNEREADGLICSGSESLIRNQQENNAVGHEREPEESETGSAANDMPNVWTPSQAEEALGPKACVSLLHYISSWTPAPEPKPPNWSWSEGVWNLNESESSALGPHLLDLRQEWHQGS